MCVQGALLNTHTHTHTHTPQPSFWAPWRGGNAVVGRGNAEWTTSKSGHPCPCQNCSRGPPAEKTEKGSLLNRPSTPLGDPVGPENELTCLFVPFHPNFPLLALDVRFSSRIRTSGHNTYKPLATVTNSSMCSPQSFVIRSVRVTADVFVFFPLYSTPPTLWWNKGILHFVPPTPTPTPSPFPYLPTHDGR